MLNKKWSSLDDERKTGGLKRGHFAEYYAEMQLTLYGFEVYKPLVDDRGIDFIIRNQNRVFFDIQVKSTTDDKNIIITRNKFIPNEHLYLVAVQFVDEKEPEMYIIPSTKWADPDSDKKIFYDSGVKNKKPQYGIELTDKKCVLLQEYKFENYIKTIKNKKR